MLCSSIAPTLENTKKAPKDPMRIKRRSEEQSSEILHFIRDFDREQREKRLKVLMGQPDE